MLLVKLKDEKPAVEKNLETTLDKDAVVNDASLTARAIDDDFRVVDDVVYLNDKDVPFYTTYNGSEEFYDAESVGANYYELSMNSDDEITKLSVAEVQEDKVEKEAEKINFESWRANGGINFLMSDGLTKYEHTGAVAASSVDDEERRIFSLMYPGWSKCLYDLGKVLISMPN